jgi:NAD(P)-dependent dehydrogenase (short-subunit alcohol dehydrogenase family)
MSATVLITGSNRGLGLAYAKHYANSGYQVIATCRSPDQATELAQLENVTVYAMDVSDEAQIAALGAQLSDTPIDILVNNAGVVGGSFMDQNLASGASSDAWIESFKINTIAPLRVVEAFLPSLRAGQQKRIVNMSSIVSCMTNPAMGGMYQYRSTKGGLNGITVGLSIDLKEEGFTVIAVHPGFVATDMGGPDAPIQPSDSVNGLTSIIDKLSTADNGKFYCFDGSEFNW